MPICNAKGVKIYYKLSGPSDGPTLVFSNSLGTTLEMWSPQASYFEDKYRILRYDGRGHGRSEILPGPYTIEDLALDVVALTSSLGIKQMSFCGLSMGGMVGLWLGSHVPECLTRLMVCNTAAKIGTREIWNQRIVAVRASGIGKMASTIVSRWVTPAFQMSAAKRVNELAEMVRACPEEGYIASCAAIRDCDLRPSLAAISVPTRIIFGEQDFVTTSEDAEFMASHIPEARAVGLPVAHLSNVEAAEQFNRVLEEFLLT